MLANAIFSCQVPNQVRPRQSFSLTKYFSDLKQTDTLILLGREIYDNGFEKTVRSSTHVFFQQYGAFKLFFVGDSS